MKSFVEDKPPPKRFIGREREIAILLKSLRVKLYVVDGGSALRQFHLWAAIALVTLI